MLSKTLHRTAVLGGLVAASAVAMGGTPASAGQGTTTHWTAPAEGTIQCGDLTLTLTGGTFDGVEHISIDTQGVEHRADSNRLIDVTASDGQFDYRLTGAGGSGGTEGSDHGRTAHLEGHFTIHDQAGGVLGRIAVVEHVYRDGTLRTVDSGSCHFEE